MHGFLISRLAIFALVTIITIIILGLDGGFIAFWGTQEGIKATKFTDGLLWTWGILDLTFGPVTLAMIVPIVSVEVARKFKKPTMPIAGEMTWLILLSLTWIASGADAIFEYPFGDYSGHIQPCSDPSFSANVKLQCGSYRALTILPFINGTALLGLAIALPIFGPRTTYWHTKKDIYVAMNDQVSKSHNDSA